MEDSNSDLVDSPTKEGSILIPESCEYVTLCRKIQFAFASWEDHPHGPNVIILGLFKHPFKNSHLFTWKAELVRITEIEREK